MSPVILTHELQQQLKLAPKQIQSIRVLQMNAQELLEHIHQLSEENPLLEQEDSSSVQESYEALCQKASWISIGPVGASFAHEEGAGGEYGVMDKDMEALSTFLKDQLDRQRLDKPLLALCRYMADLVDEDGYLLQEDLDSLQDLRIPQALIDQAVSKIQSLDPPGVGARNLAECLVLQLLRINAPPLVVHIVTHFLPELSQKHYGPISRALGVSPREIQAAEELISSLEPHPGQSFQAEEPSVYIRPDVFIVEEDGGYQVYLNDFYLPRISINQYYVRLLEQSDDPENQSYLKEKMRQASDLIQDLQRRGSTLRRCAEAILAAQPRFFDGTSSHLAPMSISGLAEELALHPSTISRAIRGKYLQCRQGIFPLRYFFSRKIDHQGHSQQAVQQMIAALIRDEDSAHPLSDQRLCQLLEEQGIHLARRTVAKYREELGIGSSTVRRKRFR